MSFPCGGNRLPRSQCLESTQIGSLWAETQAVATCVPSEGSRGECFLPFQLPEAACILSHSLFHLQNEQWPVQSFSFCSTLILVLPLPPVPTFKDPCDHIGPTWKCRIVPLMLRSVDEQTSFPLLCNITYS